jgi:hypothetical protein
MNDAEKRVRQKLLNRIKVKDITPVTRRIIVVCLGLTEIMAIIGTAFGSLDKDQAMLIIVSINTGFFSLLRGGH